MLSLMLRPRTTPTSSNFCISRILFPIAHYFISITDLIIMVEMPSLIERNEKGYVMIFRL